MTNLILFFVASIGMTHIIVDGAIFSTVRNYLRGKLRPRIFDLFSCYMCTGFWCGIIIGAILISYNPFKLFCCACCASFLSALAAMFFNYLEAQSVVDIKE